MLIGSQANEVLAYSKVSARSCGEFGDKIWLTGTSPAMTPVAGCDWDTEGGCPEICRENLPPILGDGGPKFPELLSGGLVDTAASIISS